MSLSFIIKTNVSQATDVLIPDMGLVIISGVPLTLTKNRDLADARKSNDLKALCTDNAFGLNSTLILNDGIADIVNNDLIERFINDADISKSETGIIAVNASSTTLLTGGLISINATTFNVIAGTGLGIGIDFGVVQIVNIGESLSIVGNPVVYACRLSVTPAGTISVNQPAKEELERRYSALTVIEESTLDIKGLGSVYVYNIKLKGERITPSDLPWKVMPT